MSFGRRNLKLKFKRDVITPEYLSVDRDGEVVGDVIKFYEENLGKKMSDVDWKLLLYIVGDDRLATALKHVMRAYYKPKPPPKTFKRLRDIRKKVFQYINEKYSGYLNSKIRNEALRDIALKFNLPVNLSEYLWLDERENWRLERVKKPSISGVVKTYNLEVIDTLATHTLRLKLEYRGGGSDIPKIIGRKCKFLGLVYEGRKSLSGRLHFEILGPRELYGKPTRYGSRITSLMLELKPKLYSLEDWSVTFKVKFPRRTLNVTVLSNDLKPEIPGELRVKVREAFDSKVEERIYWALKGLKLRVYREPDPIVSKSLIYIPDFRVDIEDSQVYVEVVGYWRREYLEKKAYKLAEASKLGVKLVVVADEKAKSYIEKLKLPTVYYTLRSGRPILPYGRLVKALREA